MTDEEKAEEYMHKKGLSYFDKHSIYKVRTYYMYQAYFDGLTEGRKELEQWKQEWQDTQIKANDEGFARTTLQIKYAELQKENTELLESCRDKDRQLNKWFISYNEVIKENEELKKQEEIFLDRILTLQKTNGS